MAPAALIPANRAKVNTVELAGRYVRNRASNYSPLRRGDTGGFLGEAIRGPRPENHPPYPPLRKGGDEFAISTATVGYS